MIDKNEQAELDKLRAHVKANRIGHTTHGGYRDPNGSPEGVVEHPDDLLGISAASSVLVKDIADVLMKRWPGFRWAIQPNEVGGVFNIFCLDFHSVWGFVIRYDDIMNDPKRKEAIHAGKSILRHFRYHGDKYDPVQVASLPRDVQGNCIPDVSGMKMTRFTRQEKLKYQMAMGQARVVMQGNGGSIIEVKE